LFYLSYRSLAQKELGAPQFGQFSIRVYEGPIKIPESLHKGSDGEWLDELDKWVSPPRVNFAGEYYLAAHSCGAGCRYYRLTNLRTGSEIKQISMFDAGDPTPRMRDGRTYVPILFSKPNSKLLIVQYEIDPRKPEEDSECRQRYFVFDAGRITAISKTLRGCTSERVNPN
jgi:hypothetical protein